MLREEIDLLEVDLAEVVLAYVEHLERAGELDLEAATEFLVLIAALLELKSRLMLPAGGRGGPRPRAPARRPRSCSRGCSSTTATAAPPQHLRERLEAEHGYRYRSAPLPPELRRVSLEAAERRLRPRSAWPRRSASCCEIPPPLDLRHVRRPGRVGRAAPARTCASCSRRAQPLLLRRGRARARDRLTEAVTLFALLELYKAGEAKWEQEVPFGPITVVRGGART